MEKMKFAYTASYTTESKAYDRYPAGDGVHIYRVEGDQWTEIQTVREHDPAFIAFGRDKRARPPKKGRRLGMLLVIPSGAFIAAPAAA